MGWGVERVKRVCVCVYVCVCVSSVVEEEKRKEV